MPDLEKSIDKLMAVLSDPATSSEVFNETVERIKVIELMLK